MGREVCFGHYTCTGACTKMRIWVEYDIWYIRSTCMRQYRDVEYECMGISETYTMKTVRKNLIRQQSSVQRHWQRFATI
jgi:hypothetical protein